MIASAPDLTKLDGVEILSIADPVVGSPLPSGIQGWLGGLQHVAKLVQPSSFCAHDENACCKMPCRDGIDDESKIPSTARAHVDHHAGVEHGGREALDLGQIRQIDFGDLTGLVVQRALPGCNDGVVVNCVGQVGSPGVVAADQARMLGVSQSDDEGDCA